MKKLALFLAFCLLLPGISFAAATAATVTDGTSLGAAGKLTNPVTLSPGVSLSYDSDGADAYGLNGANAKGSMCYGVQSGDQNVYQQAVKPEAGNVIDAKLKSADEYGKNPSWSTVGS